MAKEKMVLVSCGTAIATSTVVAKAIEERCKAEGIAVRTRQCKAAEIRSLAQDADLIVTTTPVPSDIGVPVIQGLACLPGIGRDQVLDQLCAALRD